MVGGHFLGSRHGHSDTRTLGWGMTTGGMRAAWREPAPPAGPSLQALPWGCSRLWMGQLPSLKDQAGSNQQTRLHPAAAPRPAHLHLLCTSPPPLEAAPRGCAPSLPSKTSKTRVSGKRQPWSLAPGSKLPGTTLPIHQHPETHPWPSTASPGDLPSGMTPASPGRSYLLAATRLSACDRSLASSLV